MERAGVDAATNPANAKTILAALRRVAGSEHPLDFLTALWPLVVGARLAEHTRPVQWKKGALQIAVSDREWQEQLERMPDALRARINKWWGANVVNELTFVRGKVGRQPAPKPIAKQRKTWPPREAKVEELKEALSRIRDPEFRALVERVAARYLAGTEED
jgi:predicted nucleic acid-binding Zn ribbon protein